MTTMLDHFKQSMSDLSTEPQKSTVIEATYLRIHPNMVWINGVNSSTSVFLIPAAMECFTYIYPNRYCSEAQFNDFGSIINMYYKYQLSSTRLFNELKKEKAKNVAPVFPVCWYVITTMPMFEEPEQHAEENVKEVEAVKEVEEVEDYDSDDSDDSDFNDDINDIDGIDY